MAEPQLLRKPLPPKEETELHISKRKGHKEDSSAYDAAKKSKKKHKEDGVQDLVPVSSPGIDLGRQALDHLTPSHPPDIKRDFIISPQLSGPPSFPSPKNYTPLRMRFLKWRDYPLHLASDFALKGFATVAPLYFPTMQLIHSKPIFSHCNYEVMTSKLIAELTRGTLHVNTFLFPFGAVDRPTPTRRPYRQLMIGPFILQLGLPTFQVLARLSRTSINLQVTPESNHGDFYRAFWNFQYTLHHVVEKFPGIMSELAALPTVKEKMLEEKEALGFLAAEISEEEIVVPGETKPKAKRLVFSEETKPKEKRKRDIAVQDTLLSGVPCKPQLTEEDEEKEQISKAEMAVLLCLLHKKTGLSLKAYFLSQIPGLSSLAGFLVYLNLSFNCLSFFPNEVFCLKNLEILKLRNNPIRFIPEDIKHMKSLKLLVMSFNLLTALPPGLFELPNLEGLDVSYNELESIPNAIGNLSNLSYLNLEGNFLFVLPCGILKLPLTQLKVENNFLHPYFWGEIPQLQIQRLTDLAALCFVRNNLEKVYGKLRRKFQNILDNYSTCSCCWGRLYGEGLRFMRVYKNAYGLRLPYIFEACSPTCYTDFTSQTNPD